MPKKAAAPSKGKKKKLPPGVRERDGRFTFRYSVYVTEKGKKRRKYKETPAYPTAQAAYDAGILIKADQLRGKLVDPKKLTLKEWRDKWIEDYKVEREAAVNTADGRINETNSFIEYIGPDTLIRDITVDDYQGWLNHLKRDGKKKGTVQQYHSGVQIMFADAVRREIITSNPADNVIIPAYKPTLSQIQSGELTLPRYCEKDELKKLLNIIRFINAQDYRISMVLAYTGLRIGELAALWEPDFSETSKVVSVTKSLTANRSIKEFRIGPPKTKSSIREVTIGRTVIKTIKEQLKYREQMIKDKRTVYDGKFIFWSMKYPGYPIVIASYEKRFKKYVEAAGLPDSITPHSLRHTHVSLLAAAGVPLSVIQERLGHKEDGTTELIYRHVTKGEKKRIPDQFEKIMSG
ncbi:tyrosine-type recombinase/integrase [Paenibacillus macerans]|uniref:Tyrosine-type recombinase/integrase n=1 Tax=Paenibacillus macerans TaxID=44252 RepID=A0A6N8EYJ3_PAEMA|nr:tyrosine-type recombinase/integrase [Paenibacillus macerans]MUG24735.1 tyrosine-type recombinase/integrase [Paenibacillus macerans]